MEKDLNEKVEQIKLLEQTLYNILMQKQVLKQQLDELENASKELENLPESKKVYRMVGNILVEKSKDELKQEVENKKEIVKIRLESLDKQETRLKERLEKLQEELSKYIGKNARLST